MTKLSITRKYEWNNMARDYGIYIDGKKIGTIANGETKEFEITAGTHKINGKIDWCKSPIKTINFLENKSTVIEIAGFKYGSIIMPVALGIMSFFFLIKYIFKIEANSFILLAGIGFLFPLYYITIGRNKYLTIHEKIPNNSSS
ncbi:hypothetical protein MHL31_00340 [Lutibacter sp. A80]|uniref:hypothetical protein n=1 Tax=Lutibacter sp. A80 TaxID=2918453 RepID=UPI001F069F99|nr:hypothetical protein [Lutibacter sp. A80]UMB60676.1 hypothetical protein MHL31_00340 [Lutibacter sp. A80]